MSGPFSLLLSSIGLVRWKKVVSLLVNLVSFTALPDVTDNDASQINLRLTGNLALANGIYNSSKTPESLPWNTYNYCNAPHVNTAHYFRPTNAPDAQLVYVNMMIRHHKRTPDNLYPNENQLNPEDGWDCTDFVQQNYGRGTAHVYHETNIPAWHPFLSQIWNGSCDSGQLTSGGLEDAIQHGKDFWDVYHTSLGFLESVNTNEIFIRTSTEDRTQQVAGGMLYGMDPSTGSKNWPLFTEPSNIDSLPPRYPCPSANSVRNAYQAVSAWSDHLVQNSDLQGRLDETLGTAGLQAWSSWYDHFFDTFTSRTCNGHPLPCNSTGACVSQEDANRVFAIGDWEYNYIWSEAENATLYNQLTFGVMFQELGMNFRRFLSGEETYKVRLYVGHDGSMVRLSAGLGFGNVSSLRWPAFGSEIVMEVWRTSNQNDFVRLMHEGTPVSGLDWIPIDAFIVRLERNIPEDIFKRCMFP